MDTTKPGGLVDLAVRAIERAATSVAEPRPAREVDALVERAKGGDPEAFDGLMRLYERRVIALGMQLGLSKDDAMDACQDTFLKVFRYMGRFRSGESFYKWLYRIATNSIYDHMRFSRPPGMVAADDLDPAQSGRWHDAGTPPDRQVVASDLARKVMGALQGLSRQERIVFVLRDLHEMTTQEIGTILGLSQITVRRHCMSARQKLREVVFPRPR
jgi:RNA polymerase sigma-70 factor (ECF subfamily)